MLDCSREPSEMAGASCRASKAAGEAVRVNGLRLVWSPGIRACLLTVTPSPPASTRRRKLREPAVSRKSPDSRVPRLPCPNKHKDRPSQAGLTIGSPSGWNGDRTHADGSAPPTNCRDLVTRKRYSTPAMQCQSCASRRLGTSTLRQSVSARAGASPHPTRVISTAQDDLEAANGVEPGMQALQTRAALRGAVSAVTHSSQTGLTTLPSGVRTATTQTLGGRSSGTHAHLAERTNQPHG
jgi:hypothetical protein